MLLDGDKLIMLYIMFPRTTVTISLMEVDVDRKVHAFGTSYEPFMIESLKQATSIRSTTSK